MTEYEKFLISKQKTIINSGFDISIDEILNVFPKMFPFQAFILQRSLKIGKAAIFADCGLGKTFMQMAWAYFVSKHTNKPVLILAPLVVTGQTIKEGVKFGIEIYKYESWNKEGIKNNSILISNYEQLKNIDCSIFGGVVLDESSILKNYSGAYRNLIIELFEKTQFKLACTATPSPNDELEIGNHAEFLNIMSSQDMRAVFFTTDKEIIKGNKYRLKRHAENDFYAWIASWALMISKPSDLGFNDKGYDLPKITYIETCIKSKPRENGKLFNDASISATSFNSELKHTQQQRAEAVCEIVNSKPNESFIIWIKHNDEGKLLREMIPGSIEVSGSDTNEYKEKTLLAFANDEFKVLITKTKIASFGMNFQNCHNHIFAALDFSFEAFYQAIRRGYRFGQLHEFFVYFITSDTMQNVMKSIDEKVMKFTKQQKGVIKNISTCTKLLEVKKMDTKIIETEFYKMYNGDCVEQIKNIESESIDYSFFSPPFGALYVFSNDPKDMSNVSGDDEFMEHFKFLIPELMRVLKPGRLVSLHVMQGTTLLGRDGFYSLKDFRGEVIRAFQEVGFYFHEEHMIRKDPKTAAIRTKNRQLMHGTTKKDSTLVRPGLADYILSFKKPGENEVPVVNNIPFDLWCAMAEPVWIDIEEGDTIDFRSGRDNKDERHITATQLKPIEWCYMMYCNVGETVLSPFSGVASEGVVALRTGRKYKGIELKESYFDISVNNLNGAIEEKKQIQMF